MWLFSLLVVAKKMSANSAIVKLFVRSERLALELENLLQLLLHFLHFASCSLNLSRKISSEIAKRTECAEKKMSSIASSRRCIACNGIFVYKRGMRLDWIIRNAGSVIFDWLNFCLEEESFELNSQLQNRVNGNSSTDKKRERNHGFQFFFSFFSVHPVSRLLYSEGAYREEEIAQTVIT